MTSERSHPHGATDVGRLRGRKCLESQIFFRRLFLPRVAKNFCPTLHRLRCRRQVTE